CDALGFGHQLLSYQMRRHGVEHLDRIEGNRSLTPELAGRTDAVELTRVGARRATKRRGHEVRVDELPLARRLPGCRRALSRCASRRALGALGQRALEVAARWEIAINRRAAHPGRLRDLLDRGPTITQQRRVGRVED